MITKVLTPYSYSVEVDGKQRHIHAIKVKKYTERIQQAVVNNCFVIYEKDVDLGVIAVVDHGAAKINTC